MSNELINRTLYRALLRATAYGKRPEVLGPFGSLHAYINSGQNNPRKLSPVPRTSKEVKDHLKFSFTNSLANSKDESESELFNGFSVLRAANKNVSYMYPPNGIEYNTLGIFDFNSTSLFPNESASFNFFEPRYLMMAKEAIHERDSWFILRGTVPAEFDDGMEQASILCQISEHKEMDDGRNIFVKVIAGQRVDVIDEIEEETNIEGSHPLAKATSYELICDTYDAFDTDEATQNLVNTVLSHLIDIEILIEQVLRNSRGNSEQCNEEGKEEDDDSMENELNDFWKRRAIRNLTLRSGLPPIDPERFSFWAISYLSGRTTQADGAKQRLSWLACRSTSHRLRHCITILEKQKLWVRKQIEYHGSKSSNLFHM